MRKKTLSKIAYLLIAVTLFSTFSYLPTAVAVTPFEQRVNDSIDDGLDYLRANQQPGGYWLPGGSYSDYVAGTSLGVLCFLNQKDPLTDDKLGYSGLSTSDQAVVDDALAYIVSAQNPDGSIYVGHSTYETGLAMTALAEVMDSGGPDYTAVLTSAIAFFVTVQVDEGEGSSPGDTYYGGWGYFGGSWTADGSNSQFALIGLRAADSVLGGGIVPQTTWDKAILFYQHLQNDPTVNEMSWADIVSNPSYNDGGGVYTPTGWSLSDTGYYGSSGSHTSFLCWSYILCGLPQEDYRVNRTLEWLRANFDYDENPNQHGWPFYYYYAWSFSKAMLFTTPSSDKIGGIRDPTADGYPEELPSWYYDLAWYLTETQHPDGTFYDNPNEQPSWTPIVDTMFAILVLEEAVAVPMTDTVTTYTGDTSGNAGQMATLSAVLTEEETGDPIDNAPIYFKFQGKTISATTGPDGVATTTVTIDPPEGPYTVTASFPGDISRRLNPSEDSAPFTVIDRIKVNIDIKPGSWPNPINVGSKGVISVAICGTEDFDATTIDPTTAMLHKEGVTVGVAALRWSYEDAATPYEDETPEEPDGHELTGDGYVDLVLKFDNAELVSTLELEDDVGETIKLFLKGNLKEENDGTPIGGSDWVRVQEPKKK